MSFTTEKHPGVSGGVSSQTSGFVFNHSMLRVKDPKISLDFYTRVMGMQVLRKLDFPEMKFSLYFLHVGVPGNAAPSDAGARTAWTFSQRGILELTHNWGTEDDAGFNYHDGNAQPQGFGHICFSVKDVAFIKDPDGYWIEIVEPARLKNLGTQAA